MKLTGKIRIVVIAVIILVAIALIPKQKQGKPSDEKEIYSVKTEKITRQDLQEYLLMNGNVKADNTISVYPDIGGKLIEVPVTLGTYVKRGQTIAEVDPSTPGTIYTKSPVVAPIEGYITSLPLTQGTTVSTSTAIARIGNIKKLQIEAQVPERDIGVLRNGLTADVTLEAYKNETFSAHIFRISPIVDETSRTKEIYYLFDTTDQRINAGMYVRLKLNTILHKNVVVVPVDAIVTESGKTYVYVLNSNQTVSKAEIETGITVDGKTEVLKGLSEGNQIVVNGIQALNDGASVHDIGGN
jgi:membrane fusion protein, multidrug efflux system